MADLVNKVLGLLKGGGGESKLKSMLHSAKINSSDKKKLESILDQAVKGRVTSSDKDEAVKIVKGLLANSKSGKSKANELLDSFGKHTSGETKKIVDTLKNTLK